MLTVVMLIVVVLSVVAPTFLQNSTTSRTLMIIATGLKEAAKLSCFPGRFTATELFFYNNQNGPAYPE
jgi:hypothetical protein